MYFWKLVLGDNSAFLQNILETSDSGVLLFLIYVHTSEDLS